MRNRANAIVALISIILLIFLTTTGIKIGNFEVLTVSQLIEKNNNLNRKIEEATILTSENYLANVETLEETYATFQTQKQAYEQVAGVTDKNNSDIYETKQYDIGYLWRVLGNYANKRNLNLGIDVKKSDIGISSYNIYFTVSGQYTSISQFLTDIENDSDLYFRIDNFKIYSEIINNEHLIIKSTFAVNNINIDPSTIL